MRSASLGRSHQHHCIGLDSHELRSYSPSPVNDVRLILSSNIKCGTVPSYHAHHAGIYHAHNIPIALCTDDKGVFSCSLSDEFRIAAETFGWSREQLFTISRQAIS